MNLLFIAVLLASICSTNPIKSDIIPISAQTIDVQYRLDSSWGSGYQAAVIITNKSSMTLYNWGISFNVPASLTSIWGMVKLNYVNNIYTFGPPSWQMTLTPGARIELGFVANGAPTDPTNYSIQGQWQTGTNPVPTPTPTPVPTPIPTPVPAAVPAKPTVSVQQVWGDPNSSYDINWAIYYGTKATSWQLFENNNLIYSAPLTAGDTSAAQTGTYRVSNNHFGAFVYTVVVSNAAGSTTSDPVIYTAGGASRIVINPIDVQQQQVQATIDQGVHNFTLSMLGNQNAQFTVSTNNPAVIRPTINGNNLNITTLKPGRSSLCITETNTGQVRYMGIRVKTADGQLPKLPAQVSIGSVSQDTASDLSFWRAYGQGLKNRWVDIRYIYINGGPFLGWRTWTNVDGGRAISYINESKKLGFIPFFVYYNIPDGGESYYTDMQHIQDQNYMEAYYKDLKFFLDIVRNQGGDELVGIVLEPDFLGYMMQNSNGTNPIPARHIMARTDAAYTSGVLGSSDPQFPNTVAGLVQSVNYIISKYAPNAIFGWQFNLWASPGITTSIESNGLMHKTDTLGMQQGQAAIAREAQVIAQYYKDAGVTSYGAHFISVDKYGLDAGISSPANPAQSTWFWNSDHWHNYLLFTQTLHNVTQLPTILWQLPVGHINATLATNPYEATGQFATLNNTSQHYEDSAPDFFFGDDFNPGSQTRFDYFATNKIGDPKITTSGSTVSWKEHITDAKISGIIALLFGAGVGDSTNNTGMPPSDGYWWITKAQKYFANPVGL